MAKDKVSYIGEYFGKKMTHLNIMEWTNDISKEEGVKNVAVMPPVSLDVVFGVNKSVSKNVSEMLSRARLIKGGSNDEWVNKRSTWNVNRYNR